MGIFLSDENISFDDLNLSNDFSFYILNQPITHIIIPKKMFIMMEDYIYCTKHY